MQRPKPSQGSGKSIPSQASKTSNSQVSSAFKLLASEKVITCHGHGEVVKQSLASQQELGEDSAVWYIVPTEEVLDNEGGEEGILAGQCQSQGGDERSIPPYLM